MLGKGTATDLAVEAEGDLVGVGWATVDLDRAAGEAPGVRFGDLGDEPALGGRALRARVGSIDLVLLEPSTEGRLAGWLARNGEGVAALYVEPVEEGKPPGLPTALGRTGRLEIPDDRTRPFLIKLDPG